MTRKTRFPMHTPVAVGDYIYGVSGSFEDQAAAKMMAIEAKTGKRVWKKRMSSVASCVYGDGKLIMLDVDGRLTLATTTPKGLTVHSQCNVTDRYSLSAPALVGTALYVRDRKHIMALDLGVADSGERG
ncbi:MAG: hypothetical protein JSU63_19015 [Phycisphaerales bacterium]|nr:MAG: hypothetical protein JSU63_19015 [Phycisphaerales bacterium]